MPNPFFHDTIRSDKKSLFLDGEENKRKKKKVGDAREMRTAVSSAVSRWSRRSVTYRKEDIPASFATRVLFTSRPGTRLSKKGEEPRVIVGRARDSPRQTLRGRLSERTFRK
ncbi:hypothetical protein Bpfe_017225 [Biomphalaria pfeifferi]|uniref:Uncharacterized protein n=1 Tax=Biomphalaria pfeifferi TaxID=112525 RepID=A0AAD8BEV2_BIOPF|nr:hypothetical protein Bpfe_017225 [Biomphalaria pfeifferi]